MTHQEQYAALPALLLPWFAKNARKLPWREDKHPYHIWLSEIMLQQTRVEAVKAYYSHFLSVLPTIEQLSLANDELLYKLWEGLGYYSRVRNMKKAAVQIISQYDGIFPSTYEQILTLPGIGEYTAGAIASICFDLPTPAVDGNVLRVVSRLTENPGDILQAKTKKQIFHSLQTIYPSHHCGEFTQSLMELGATVCLPNGEPKCIVCPLRYICSAYLHDTTHLYPQKKAKASKKLQQKTVWIFCCDGTYAICRRPTTGLLASMWQFPNTDQRLSEQDALAQAQKYGVSPIEIKKKVKKEHIFTHLRWEMTAYYIDCAEKSSVFTWAAPNELKERYAFPTAFRQFLNFTE